MNAIEPFGCVGMHSSSFKALYSIIPKKRENYVQHSKRNGACLMNIVKPEFDDIYEFKCNFFSCIELSQIVV
jgi:hypothetical protein